MPHPVDSRLRGNDGEEIMRIYRIGSLFWMTGMGGRVVVFRIRIFRIGTMRCIVEGICMDGVCASCAVDTALKPV